MIPLGALADQAKKERRLPSKKAERSLDFLIKTNHRTTKKGEGKQIEKP